MPACALAAVEAFFGEPLHEDVVAEGLAAVRVPGRLEVIGRHPLVLVDGAHNAAGMMVLARSLTEEFATDGRSVAVVGMLSGRDPRRCSRRSCPPGCGPSWPALPAAPGPLPAVDVAEAAFALGMEVAVADDPAEAVRLAVERSDPRTSSWCVARSMSWPMPGMPCVPEDRRPLGRTRR